MFELLLQPYEIWVDLKFSGLSSGRGSIETQAMYETCTTISINANDKEKLTGSLRWPVVMQSINDGDAYGFYSLYAWDNVLTC
jgi:hypothetical protein